MDLKRIRALIQLAKDEGLAEIEYQKGSERISVRLPQGGAANGSAGIGAQTGTVAGAVAGSGAGAGSGAALDKSHTVISPFVGTFYRAPSPGVPSFVDVGSLVKRGQTLCIVEAMKLMNEIEADCDGRIVDILVANGEAVEYGEALFKIEPIAARA
ncbi:MAG: acetyl-CoA carboxylase biotin carboxyl carrier protein [Deltaproteobacteria bacterium]|nr:acetyl-CoA carboxylase biotin carboxyl carrier protein [Deltaproteobacteria bacterium]